jgi:hypothetical protein
VSTVSGLPSASLTLPSGASASDTTFSPSQETELAAAQLGGEALGALLPAPTGAEGDVLGPLETVTPDYILSLSSEWQMLADAHPSAPATDLPSPEDDPASVYDPTADDGVTGQDVSLVAPDDGGVSFLA